MSEYVTKTELKTALREQTDEIAGIIHIFAEQVDTSFSKIEKRLDLIEQKYNHLISTIDGFVALIDR